MSRPIPESDWKQFRRLREVALERFCERVLGEIGCIASNGANSSHNRYLEIFKLIENRDDELARAFNDLRRSTAIFQLAAIYSLGLLQQDELDGFSTDTRETVESLCKPAGSARPQNSA